jgi:PhzF family phenazine biosynthesis protein
MDLTIHQVDAFAERPFSGNPAAVCVLPSFPAAAWMQAVAAEMNLAETAFLVRRAAGEYDLRWFTPLVEVELCGHATLASAHVLWQTAVEDRAATIVFHTLSGALMAWRDGEWIELDFPAEPPSEVAEPPADLRTMLGATPLWVGRNRFDLVVELADEAAVGAVEPNLQLLKRMPYRGLVVTARATRAGYDLVSRFFGPQVGIDEDPVTGSAHCSLGPLWSARLGKDRLLAYQMSRRGGTVRVTVRGDRVILGGQAVSVLRGDLLVAAGLA